MAKMAFESDRSHATFKSKIIMNEYNFADYDNFKAPIKKKMLIVNTKMF